MGTFSPNQFVSRNSPTPIPAPPTHTRLPLSQAPSLAFTVLNERIGDLRLAMVSILAFHVIGMLLLTRIDLEQGLADAAKTADKRFKVGVGEKTVDEAEVGVELAAVGPEEQAL